MTLAVSWVTLSSKVDKSIYSHHCSFSRTYVGMGSMLSAMIDVGNFSNIDDSLGTLSG